MPNGWAGLGWLAGRFIVIFIFIKEIVSRYMDGPKSNHFCVTKFLPHISRIPLNVSNTLIFYVLKTHEKVIKIAQIDALCAPFAYLEQAFRQVSKTNAKSA